MSWLEAFHHHPEMQDGSAPEGEHLSESLAKGRPLDAFTLLSGGDVFEAAHGRPPPDGERRARAYLRARVRVELNGASPALGDKVQADMARLLSGNSRLVDRLEVARPLDVELIPPGRPMSAYGFPKSTPRSAVGLFWDRPEWERARMALCQDKLPVVPQLTVHEMAHAIHFLAFTDAERSLIYRVLLPTFGSRAAADEAFAIYTEREFVEAFTEADKRAPDVYGFTRQRWNEDHLFTRFVRYLYFPHKPLAGPKLASALQGRF